MASIQSTLIRILIKNSVNWNKPLSEVRRNLDRMGGKLSVPADIQ